MTKGDRKRIGRNVALGFGYAIAARVALDGMSAVFTTTSTVGRYGPFSPKALPSPWLGLLLALSAAFGVYWGRSLPVGDLNFKRVVAVGVKVPAATTLVFVFSYIMVGMTIAIIGGRVPASYIIDSVVALVLMPLFSLLVTFWVTFPIGILASWGLAAFSRHGRQCLAALLMLTLFHQGMHQLLAIDDIPAATRRIALDRPVGSPCFTKDSASASRTKHHPLGPTGGWYGNLAIDTSRTVASQKNDFRNSFGMFEGNVAYSENGTLRIRAYDNLYGAVYCGWHPDSIGIPALTDGRESVLVQFPRCFIGDGGVETVHEICWFPEGKEVGQIVYSTAW